MKELHLICNAHIDPVWQWEWEEGIATAFSTFNSAVNLADKYDYIFCHNEAVLYKYIEKYAPELFEKITHLIEVGKWKIIGGWFIQPDCTMPSGESFVRQIGYGKKYFKEKFGVEPRVALNFDSFGHTRGLVQILKKTGYEGYFHCRPNNSQFYMPYGEYLWKGFDGSVIKAVRRFDYSSQLGQVDKKFKTYIDGGGQDDPFILGNFEKGRKVEIGDYQVMFWGVGNHGGGPSDKDLAYLKSEIESRKDIKVMHSTPENFFAKINPTYVVDKSLYTSMPGCYTTMSNVKHKHREVENLFYSTEKLASICALNGLIDYPNKEFENACEDLMTAEFHDTLPGTVIEKGEQNAIRLLEHGKEELNRIKTQSFFALTINQKKAKDGEYPIFVFNYQPYEIYNTVEVEFSLKDQNWTDKFAYVNVYSNGEKIDCQQIKEDSNLTGLDWRKKIVFDTKLKPLSINRFDIKIEFDDYKLSAFNQCLTYKDQVKSIVIGEDGLLKSYVVNGQEYITGGFNLFAYEDNSDPWGMKPEYQKGVAYNPKPFIPLSSEECKSFCNDNTESNVRVIEDGKIIKRIESYFKYNNSFAKIEYTIYKNHPYIDIKTDIYNNEKDTMIRLHFPTFNDGKLYGDTAFGTDELFMDGRENTSQKFIYTINDNAVFGIINDGTYGSCYNNGVICQSLIRSAGYCTHPIPNNPLLKTDRYTERIDQKKCSFAFRIIGLDDKKEVAKFAQEFAEKPFSLNLFPLGDNDKQYCNLEIDNKDIILVAFKKAEDGQGYVIRLQNNLNKKTTATINVLDKEKTLDFGCFEVKTLRFNNSFSETDMII